MKDNKSTPEAPEAKTTSHRNRHKAGIRAFPEVSRWNKELIDKFNIPFFRMSACNSRKKPFNHLSEDECDRADRVAISIVADCAIFGYSTIVDQDEYREILSSNGFEVHPYSFLAWNVLKVVSEWRDRYYPSFKSNVFFEKGFKNSSQVDDFIDRLNQVEEYDLFKITAIAFPKKEDSFDVQAADLIAWHSYKNYKRSKKGMMKRGDFNAILNSKIHTRNIYKKEHLIFLRTSLIASAGSLERASAAIFNPNGPLFSQSSS